MLPQQVASTNHHQDPQETRVEQPLRQIELIKLPFDNTKLCRHVHQTRLHQQIRYPISKPITNEEETVSSPPNLRHLEHRHRASCRYLPYQSPHSRLHQ